LPGVWARGVSKNFFKPLLICATAEASNFKFGIHFWFVSSLPKQSLGQKLMRVWARGASK